MKNIKFRTFGLALIFVFAFLLVHFESQQKSSVVSVDTQEKITVPYADDVWTATHEMSANENAAHHFEKHGTEFHAKSKEDYVRAALAFVLQPPKGTLQVTQKDGDTVFFHPPTGVFAIQTRQGKLRTYFRRVENLRGYKSNMAYFNEQAGRR